MLWRMLVIQKHNSTIYLRTTLYYINIISVWQNIYNFSSDTITYRTNNIP